MLKNNIEKKILKKSFFHLFYLNFFQYYFRKKGEKYIFFNDLALHLTTVNVMDWRGAVALFFGRDVYVFFASSFSYPIYY